MDVIPWWRFRLILFPILDRVVPDRIHPYFVAPMHPAEYVGVWDVDAAEARRRLRAMDHTYPAVAAAQRRLTPATRLSQRTGVSLAGPPVYAHGSFAIRPDGRFGEWQTHVRLVPTTDGRVTLWAHRERNPLAYPKRHLDEDGFDIDTGVGTIRDLFPVTRVPLADITLTNDLTDTMADTTSDTKTKRAAQKKQATLAVIVTVAPIVAGWVNNAVSLTGGVSLTGTTAVLKAAIGVAVFVGLLVARYIYDIESVPEEVSVGLIVRVTTRLARLVARP